MGDTLSITVLLRLAISLAILVGALYAVKYWQRRPGIGAKRGAIDVIARATLGRSASVNIIDVGNRRFLIGTGEHQVNLLTELEQPADPELGGGEPTPAMTGGVTGTGGPDGSGLTMRTRPRIGPMDWLRTITVRTPQQVRVIRDHDV